jgi:S1-C subfamily serine protease
MRKIRLKILMMFMLAAVMGTLVLPARAHAISEENMRRAVVKIFTVSAPYNYYVPWRMTEPRRATGSGCVIAEGRIITNAHVVADARYIQFQMYGDPQRYNARVLHVAHEADLALIEPEDPGVLKGIDPLKLGRLPRSLDEVLVYGYPLGGNTLSITKGVLSRVEFQTYAHSNSYFLAGQIDAAINAGNSGGPVIVGRKVVGITMQKQASGDVDNIGYMIPTPMIRHFLDDVDDGTYDGYPLIGFNFQDMESPALRAKYRMAESERGVLVNRISWNSPAMGVLETGDVILSIDGHDIANDGTVEFRRNERISFAYHVHVHQLGEEVVLRVLRGGGPLDLTVPLRLTGDDMGMVLPHQFEREPAFFIFGGMVFTPLSTNYLCTWKNCNAPASLMAYLNEPATEEKREVVLLTRVLPSAVNEGYHNMGNFVVEEVNGEPYRDFREFHELVTGSPGRFVTLTSPGNDEVVIDRKAALDSHTEVLATYGIEKDQSSDLVK